ncbi:MAG: 4Fe-4S ferredoxin [Candidatus Hodarchaeota archaeon]
MIENCPMLLSINVGAKYLRQANKYLLVGSCVPQEYPELFQQLAQDRVCLHVCLETFHMNMAETKLACITKIHQPEELLVLTVDGSPHCFQLHVLAEDMKRYFNLDSKIQHLVIEHGRLQQVSSSAVKTARHLNKVQHLLEK